MCRFRLIDHRKNIVEKINAAKLRIQSQQVSRVLQRYSYRISEGRSEGPTGIQTDNPVKFPLVSLLVSVMLVTLAVFTLHG